MDHRIVTKKLQMLQGMAAEFVAPVPAWQYRTADHLAPYEYVFAHDWRRAKLPLQIPAGRTVIVKGQASVPRTAAIADTYLSFSFQDMEGILRVDGKAYAGLDANHMRVPVPKHGRIALEAEFISVPAVLHLPELASRSGCFSGASICTADRVIEAFCYDVRFAWETARLITDPRRKPLLEEAIEAALLAVDLTLPRDRLLGEVSQATRILKRRIAGIAPDPEAGSLFAVGHTHIDTAWLWPLRESIRKCGRTFSTACRLMERYPDFHFTCSQPQLYQYTKQHFPEVYAQIRKWVRSGRWETAGAMWVEADCNVTSGESLIRQMLYGIEFFRREFGTRPRMCWLPDVFGYPSSLPEILAGCGVKYFYTYKLHWQATNRFPAHLFRWRGLDGTEVMAHVVNHLGAYNNYPAPDQILKGWELYAQKAEYPEVIFPFGYGDGGGGVNEDMMEMLQRAKGQYPGLPAVRTGTAEQFFDNVAAAAPALPVWDGELYVETHRGTYTTQSAMKRANRTSELLLREAEILGCVASLRGHRFSARTLRHAWEDTLVHQFHDILPGSSIGMVYTEALQAHARVQTDARRSADASLTQIVPCRAGAQGNAVFVFNSLSWPRADVVTVEVPDPGASPCITGTDGIRRPAQVISRAKGKATLVFHPAQVPPMGYAVFPLAHDPAPRAHKISCTPTRIENPFFRITLNRDGAIQRLYDKRNRRDVLPRGSVGNDLQLLQDGPEHEDAWNVHPSIDGRRYSFEGKTRIRVVETGPVRGLVRVQRAHRKSMIEQDIVVYADIARIDFVTRVDWQERNTMLKAAFPLAVRSTRATYEVQFGAYERPTHRNTSWDQQKFEVPGQRWADISESGYGVSLLNDSRYGYDAKDNVLRLTLLRSTTFPDPQADRGRHEFTYSLYPHAGGWVEAQTVRRAWELNVPARPMAMRADGQTPEGHSYVSVEGAGVVIETLKPAEDGQGLILRLYEPHGARGDVTVRLGVPVSSVSECNLVEEDGERLAVKRNAFRFAIGPFQIRTFRLLLR